MSRTVTTSDIKIVINDITNYATKLGLIPSGSRVVYYKGNQSNGISAWLEVVENEGTPNRASIPESFLPVFSYKIGRSQQYRELTATFKVLWAMWLKNNRPNE